MKNVADIYALSPMQQLMLFHARAAKDSHDVLFNQIVYEIDGPLDEAAYQRAWQLMVDRHPALRTLFIWQDGKDPLQVVREHAALPWTSHDWRALPPAEQEAALAELLSADRAAGFDPMIAPLMRLTLVRQADSAYVLVWSSHHLIVDRWCIGILFDELKVVYEASAGHAPALKPAPRYRDYIAWLVEQDVDEAKAFWQESLRDVEAQPLVGRSSSEEATALDVHRFAIDGEAWAAARQFALEHNLTPSTLLSGAWALVLSAATNSDDALFGLTVSGRPAELPDVGRTVGCFINNVPLRVSLSGDPLLAPWLQALQDQQLALQPFEYASLAQIETWSGSRSRGALFDTLLVLQAPVELSAPDGLAIQYAGGGMQTGYPISLGAVPDREQARLTFTYERPAVSTVMIEQLAEALPQVVAAMGAGGTERLSDVRRHVHIDVPQADLVAPIEIAPSDGRAYVPSRTRTEKELATIWAGLLGVPRVGVTDRFSDLGGDSIKALQLFTAVEERLDVSLPISLLFGDPTVAQMAAAIGQDESEFSADPVIVPIREDGTRPPVFFTHGVQGGLIWLKHVAPLLDPDLPAYGLQAIGLQAGAEPDRSMEAMATRYVEAMRRVQPVGPYYLAGFCFGGVLAYEVARQLEEQGERTGLLAIIDGFPPHVFHRKRALVDPLRMQAIRQSAPHWVRGYEAFGGMRLRERLQARLGTGSAAEADGPSEATNGNFAEPLDPATASSQRHQQLTRINEQAGDTYMPRPYGGDVTLLRAELLGVRQALFGPVDPMRGWGTLAAGGVHVRTVEGSHVGMLSPPFVTTLAAQLNDALRAAMLVNS